MYKAKIFLDKKQDEHFKKHRVYADVNSKIAEWMQEYTDNEVKKLTIPVVGVTLVCEECKEHKELKYCEDCYNDACGAM